MIRDKRIEERAESAATVNGELGADVTFLRVNCEDSGDLCSFCESKSSEVSLENPESKKKTVPALYIFIKDGKVVDRAGFEALGALNNSPKKFIERMRKSFNIPKKETQKPVADSGRPETTAVSFNHHWNARPEDKISPRVRPRNRL